MENTEKSGNVCPQISDDDIMEAMKDSRAYIDVTPADLKEIYRHAFRRAFEKLSGSMTPVESTDKKASEKIKSPPRVSLSEIIWSWIGAFAGIGFISFMNYQVFEKIDVLMIVGSFGASAVLIYGAIKSPLAQPRNLIGGHILSALVGVGTSPRKTVPQISWNSA